MTLRPEVKYQTIRGWSCNPFYLDGSREQREQVIDEAVNSLGITRLRWQQPNGNRATMTRWELENDNGDPDDTDLSRFNTEYTDRHVEAYILPFKRRVEANGDPFELWLSPSFFHGGSTGSVPAFLLHSPGEYAEHATSFIQYLRSRHKIETHHYAICNEAGNNNAFKPAVVAELTKVLGKRMQRLRLPTMGQFSDGINARVAWNYIRAAATDADVWKHIDVLSYHWYGRGNQRWMATIRRFADQHGMDTAQTEFMHLTIDHLFDDLTIGGVSYWSIYGLGGPGPGGQNFWFRPDNTSFRRGEQFWSFRQVMRYVRPGAVRIEAALDTPAVRGLAFLHRGRTTVVLINTTPPQKSRPVTISGLAPGRYGVCASVSRRTYREMGVVAVDTDGRLKTNVPTDAVLTVYPHPGGNLAPVVTTWEARPTFLRAPAARAVLQAAAQDPERDRLSFAWTVARQPRGANAAFADPTAAKTAVNGLAAPGSYAFTVTVSDGTDRAQRDVLLNVFEGNQPPRLIDVHNRIPVLVTLPTDSTNLRGGAFDLEGDRLRFAWDVVKQPPSSDVRIEPSGKGRWKLTNITKPGVHVLRFTANDKEHAVARDLTIPVFPVNQAPVIETIGAAPGRLTTTQSETVLSATTRDPDGDVLSHWWRVVNRPADARPVFEKQAGRGTKVTGLTVEGVYEFELTVVDRTKFSRRRLAVAVGPEPETPDQPADPPTQRSADDRAVLARGTLAGTVVARDTRWIEIRSDTGKTARYIPRWIGGRPRDGGGPERTTLQAISGLRVGDRVSVTWHVNDHLRIGSIQRMP